MQIPGPEFKKKPRVFPNGAGSCQNVGRAHGRERSRRSVNSPFMATAAVMVVNFDIAQTSKSKISLVIFFLQVRPFETSWALLDVRS